MATLLPDYTDTTRFPTFLTIPENDPDAPPSSSSSSSSQQQSTWYLLAQVKDNMTINKPTLVLTDRDGNPFALVFEGLGRDELDLKGLGLKKGCTAVIPNAKRTRPAEEGKRGFVRIDKRDAGTVRAVPGALARVLEVGGREKGDRCETCGGAGGDGGEEGLKSCTGCARVGYCGKVSSSHMASKLLVCVHSQECQVKGWVEGGHKTDCKMFKALNDIFA
ncbi:hypothetical protein M406DRAFT_268930 [Cryphonectria parasitica EP155]|uniref:MYND-type zinc finger protein samB n=1 Tax=Cryphonectria parasitica (strain ATCC 38755 / EP155) TaxID=660469 RepID=A0A9P5CIK5_CRYP1|nr:uncharacterized protein M406DRAFT_268930 [Cryphonectria parasitica EP155]KAF3760593.1 hypothetical protein M406DRAFT_268930 [Cryphonectria parasitica EP155]